MNGKLCGLVTFEKLFYLILSKVSFCRLHNEMNFIFQYSKFGSQGK